MNRIIDNDIVEALLRYLIIRPYNEVHQVIPILQNLPILVESKPEDKKPEEAHPENLESTQ